MLFVVYLKYTQQTITRPLVAELQEEEKSTQIAEKPIPQPPRPAGVSSELYEFFC